MKQYLPNKPFRRGFKVWVVAESNNGYFLDVDVYAGWPFDGVTTEHGLGPKIVLQLTEPYRHKNYRVFCDNYVTSPGLFDELLQHGIYACGTVQSNRHEFPSNLTGLQLERGSHRFLQRGSLSALVGQDKRLVSVLSTLTTPEDGVFIQWKEKDGTRTTLSCPTTITTHNRHMAGVDKGDKLQRYYRMKFMNYNFFLLDTAIINAYILYSKYSTTPKVLGFGCHLLKSWSGSIVVECKLVDHDCPQLHTTTPPNTLPLKTHLQEEVHVLQWLPKSSMPTRK